MSGSRFVGRIHNFQEFFGGGGNFLKDALNLNIIAFVLHDVQGIFFVEQVETSASVYFEETDHDFMSLDDLKEFGHEILLKLVHGVSFSGPGLPVSEAGDNSVVDQHRY